MRMRMHSAAWPSASASEWDGSKNATLHEVWPWWDGIGHDGDSGWIRLSECSCTVQYSTCRYMYMCCAVLCCAVMSSSVPMDRMNDCDTECFLLLPPSPLPSPPPIHLHQVTVLFLITLTVRIHVLLLLLFLLLIDVDIAIAAVATRLIMVRPYAWPWEPRP